MKIVTHIPNALSILRAVLAPLVGSLLIRHEYRTALACFVLAGISDWLDGFLARRFHLSTVLGSFLDPAADKLLLLISVLTLGWMGLLPSWLVFLVILRDAVIVGGAITYWRLSGAITIAPLAESKINTLTQILLVAWTTAAAGGVLAGGIALELMRWVTATTTVISGIRYVLVWGGKHRYPERPTVKS